MLPICSSGGLRIHCDSGMSPETAVIPGWGRVGRVEGRVGWSRVWYAAGILFSAFLIIIRV